MHCRLGGSVSQVQLEDQLTESYATTPRIGMIDMRAVGWDWGLVTDKVNWLDCLLGDLCIGIPVYQ